MKVIKEEMYHFEDKFAKTYENFLSKRFYSYPVPYPYPTWAKKFGSVRLHNTVSICTYESTGCYHRVPTPTAPSREERREGR
jgi:hypothetical protein